MVLDAEAGVRHCVINCLRSLFALVHGSSDGINKIQRFQGVQAKWRFYFLSNLCIFQFSIFQMISDLPGPPGPNSQKVRKTIGIRKN